MPLTGQAKTDYQREYMRKRRSNTEPVDMLWQNLLDPSPLLLDPQA